MKIPITKNIIARHQPQSIRPETRFQFGYMVERAEMNPLTNGFTGHGVVFMLCGHGSTIERAAKMAGVVLEKEAA